MAEVKKHPVFYLIMRGDLDSMNAGKAMAQATHAMAHCELKMSKMRPQSPIRKLYEQWKKETNQGFGTALVLDGTPEQFDRAVEMVEQDGGRSIIGYDPFMFGTLHDPSYPLRDGKVTHLIPLDTCCWAFCDRAGDFAKNLQMFKLHTRGWSVW